MELKIKILPSLLGSDFGFLGRGAEQAEEAGADALHMDVMDGHFVPNISMGPDIIKMAKRTISIPLNVHLMISNPADMAPVFIDSGADCVLIHIEPEYDVAATLDMIRSRGVRPGIVLNPATPAEAVFDVLDKVDEVLAMTVVPGYGGQEFISDVLPKIRSLRDELNRRERAVDILVDGGINPETAARCAAHGANSFIAGSALYRAADMKQELGLLRAKAEESFVQ